VRKERCIAVSGALGISLRDIRRALLHELMVEARLHREGNPVFNEEQEKHHEKACLAASLLVAHDVREEILQEITDNAESWSMLPTSDFGPGSNFDPDWGGDSDSSDDHAPEASQEKVPECKPTADENEQSLAKDRQQGVRSSMLPVGWGAVLPAIAQCPTGNMQSKPCSECLPLQQKGMVEQSSAAASLSNKYVPQTEVSQDSSDHQHTTMRRKSRNIQETTPPSCHQPRRSWAVFNCEGQECGHYARAFPPLATCYADMKTLGIVSQIRKVTPSIEHVVTWLKDQQVFVNLKPPVLTAFEWPGKVSIREAEHIHSVGKWYRFELREPRPGPLAGTDTTCSTKYSHKWADYRRCIHSTSLYVLPSILHQGLLPGKHPGKGGARGVYCYEMITKSLAVKSSQYCVYASPRSDGVFWGPRLEIQVAVGCAMHHAKSINVGGRQYAAFEGSYSMTALWVHLITQDELQLAWQEPVGLWYCIDAWRPELLVPRDVEQ
jgi:hypothetical protein